MKQLPAYLKDTTQFLNQIDDIPVQNDTWLVTVDVKSLYTNIPNDEGIQACYEAWHQQEIKDPQHPPAEVLRHLLEMVLKLNTFEFDGKHYLQKFGTAMGSKLAPAYANTFMGKLEKTILDNSPLKPTYYHRFIDDIIMIWPHSEDDLKNLITHMNQANRSIQFTYECSQKEVVFLDVVVYKKDTHKDGDTLQTRTHIKPTNKQLYVREDSHHPPGTCKGVTIGEVIRYLRTNSDPAQFSKAILKHKRNLVRKGYNPAKITSNLKKIQFSTRKTRALKTKEDKSNKSDTTAESNSKPTYVTRYCPNARKAFRIVYKHWANINTEIPTLKRFLKITPRLAYRANANLSKRLVKAKLKPITDTNQDNPLENTIDNTQNHTCSDTDIRQLACLKHSTVPVQHSSHQFGVKHCNNTRCPLHNKLIHSQRARSRVSRRTYSTHGHATCDTQYVVYLIQCKKCGRQYVGQTQKSLKARYAKHLQAIRDRRRRGVLQEHFRDGSRCSGINNITIQLLHRVIPDSVDTPEAIEENLKHLETLWIDRLKCEFPQGLNWKRYDPQSRCHN